MNNSNHISIIIPTLNRQNDLFKCLQSISKNSLLPYEVLIIEQGNFKKTKNLISIFPNLNIKVYFLNVKSLTAARNFGVKKSKGNIIIFFDDDVTIDKNYFKLTLEYFKKSPNIYGITGIDLLNNKKSNLFLKFIGLIFNISSFSNKNIVLNSGQNILSLNLTKEEYVEWLSGCNMVYKRDVFENDVFFNENFIRWCFGEDVMFSYQIYKKYGPKSLLYSPKLKIKHFQSPENRLTNEKLIKMKVIYRFIFWKKEIYNNNFLIFLIYIWSQLGLIFLEVLSKRSFKPIFYYIESYIYLIKNFKKIENYKKDYNSFIIGV